MAGEQLARASGCGGRPRRCRRAAASPRSRARRSAARPRSTKPVTVAARLVAVELAVGVAGVVVDERVHPLVADPHPFLGAGAVAVAGDGVAGPGEADEAFAVDVQQIAGAGPLVAAWLLARLPRRPRDPGPLERPPDGRVRMPGLAGDQPWPPAGAAPRRADPLLLDGRQQPRAAVRPRRAILETGQRPTLLERRLRPAPPPLTRRRRRDAAASRRLTTRTARLDISDQRAAASKSETSVTVKPHPGPSFDCEPWQTHSLEGGPDDLLSRPQPVEARQLDPSGSAGTLLPVLTTNRERRRRGDGDCARGRTPGHRRFETSIRSPL